MDVAKNEGNLDMIDYKSILKMSIVSLKVNKLRSALTSLGIIIGVAAVIIMLAIGTGTSEKVQKDMVAHGCADICLFGQIILSGHCVSLQIGRAHV